MSVEPTAGTSDKPFDRHDFSAVHPELLFPGDEPEADRIIRRSFLLGREQAPLEVTARRGVETIDVHFQLPKDLDDCILHWGLARRSGGKWTRPPRSCWPEQTVVFDDLAVRTPLRRLPDGTSEVRFSLPVISVWTTIEFVLFFPKTGQYFKNRRYDFTFPLPVPGKAVDAPSAQPVEAALEQWLPGEGWRHKFLLDSGHELAVCRIKEGEGFTVGMVCNAPRPLFLHWGVSGAFNSGWFLPDPAFWPEESAAFDDKAVRSPFVGREGLSWLQLYFPAGAGAPEGIQFLIYQANEDLWIKYNNNDMSVQLFAQSFQTPFADPAVAEFARTIVACEVGKSSWTLMHRFRLCEDILNGYCRDSADGQPLCEQPRALALLLVWLRFSAIRQLDWQRNYNTKPRDLAGAQQALTGKLAGLWREHPPARGWLRLILQTLGRGGDGGQGQQIRDEILNIMHRHKIPETKGHFLEEWHQKLHNNTTPDDVGICEAYIEYLRGNGRLDNFYTTLQAHGITRERLSSFERPITTEPNFFADKRDGLLGDFQNYLRILKAVHGGGGLSDALDRAGNRMDGGLRERIRGLCNNANPGIHEITRLREDLAPQIERTGQGGDIGALLDLLYLDFALEERLRREFEALASSGAQGWADLLAPAIRCAQLGAVGGAVSERAWRHLPGTYVEELELCRRHWLKLLSLRAGGGRDWALEALSCLERLARLAQDEVGGMTQTIQPLADFLGGHFRCAAWTVKLFAEEVVRGGAVFPLSKLLHALTQQMRQEAGLGGWQVIGPAHIKAVIEEIDDLHAVQEKVYETPTLLLVAQAGGDEEVPPGAAGLITRIAPDLVSHLSVRARNLGALFAACFEDAEYDRLRALVGSWVEARTTPDGRVEYSAIAAPAEDAAQPAEEIEAAGQTFDASGVHARAFTRWAVGYADFTREILGGKSNNLNLLCGKLPEWIRLPASMALPFGAAEAALADPVNAAAQAELARLLPLAEQAPSQHLTAMRAAVEALQEPAGLREEFERVRAACEGLEALPWADCWRTIKRVWASKWNDRAFLSRRRLGLPHEKLQMAVLVQQVVRADFAFVIHTVDPVSGDRGRVFAEVVPGLGETLVGNYPGRSLGFTCRKDSFEVELHSLPGKSIGLYGGGVIFRSDSNGEDLEGFAGAGLYDSFLAQGETAKLLDYTDMPLLRDRELREDLIRKVARLALEVERVCGAPQDIEGAVENGVYYVVQNRPQVGLL